MDAALEGQTHSDEQPECRVCRAGAEEGPLFHPCRCVGSIAWVHEDCLNSWLARSKKAKCELCGVEFQYTSIFSEAAPESLPLPLVLKAALKTFSHLVLLVIRAAVVALAWLACLPYGTLWVLRFYLYSAESLAEFVQLFSKRISPAHALRLDTNAVLHTVFDFLVRAVPAVDPETALRSKEAELPLLLSVFINRTESWARTPPTLRSTPALLTSVSNSLLGTISTSPSVTPYLATFNGTAQEKEEIFRVGKKFFLGLTPELLRKGPNATTVNPIGNLTATVLNRPTIARYTEVVQPWRRFLSMLAKDTFNGQIITSTVVIFFVFGFLLREWIIMNAPFDANAQNANNANANPAVIVVDPVVHPDNRPLDEEEVLRVLDGLDDDANDFLGLADEANRAQLQATLRQLNLARGEDGVREQLNAHFDARAEPTRDDNLGGASEEAMGYGAGRLPQQREPTPPPTWEIEFANEDESGDGSDVDGGDDAVEEISGSSGKDVTRGETKRRRDRLKRLSRERRSATWNATPGPSSGGRTASGRLVKPLPKREEKGKGKEKDDSSDDGWSSYEDEDGPDVPEDVSEHTESFWGDIPPLEAPDPVDLLPPPPPLNLHPLPPPPVHDDEWRDEEGERFDDDAILDDFEGVLEAVGMRGPILVLVQNMGLMHLLIAICMGGAIWLPLCLGKVLAAGNAVRLLASPLLAVRAVSDPIFDFVFAVLAYVPRLVLSTLRDKPTPTPTIASENLSVSDLVGNATAALEFLTQPAPHKSFAKTTLEGISRGWLNIAFVDDNFHRGLCVALGYAATLFGGMVYLQSTKTAYGRSVNKAIREGVKQQFTLLKVVIFVFVEIVLFPALCGFILNLASVPLFAEITLSSRLAFYQHSPVSALFLTWLSGSAFMFTFSNAIDTVRDVVRDGTMWFIRDPSSQEFHPIREILERNSSVQARKIAQSAVLYGGAIFMTFGVNIMFLRYAVGILPLRWPSTRTFSFPLDLLFYRFVIPSTIRLVDPGHRVKKVFLGWAKFTAHELRLSSFIFGGDRDPQEEGTNVRRTWRARLTLRKADINDLEEDVEQDQVSPRDVVFRKDGGFARVPAIDNIRVAPGRKMIVRVTEEGRPLDEEGERTIQAQVEEMGSTRKSDRYCVVYVPPFFKTRLALFVYLLWFTGSLAGQAAVVGPLVLGRYIVSLVTSAEVHDIYSLAVGFYLAGTASFLVHRAPSFLSFRPTRRHYTAIKVFAVSTVLGGLALPILASLLISTYLLLPFSLASDSSTDLPTIYVLESWAIGCVAVSSGYHILRSNLVPSTQLRRDIDVVATIWKSGHYIAAAKAVNRLVLWPLTWRLAIVVFLPGLMAATAWTNAIGRAAETTWNQFLRWSYSGAAIAALSAIVSGRVRGLAKKWVSRLREEVYLVERRLRNFEAPSPPPRAEEMPELEGFEQEVI
ncbi:hypothetical protein MNV49_003812 [Pseudohyphozyma bogoriensis]|nr:hypothetical protein MNV49_003812 [Pseudohyphozyma bogoriensis]